MVVDNDAELEMEQTYTGNIKQLLEELKSLLPPQLKRRKSGRGTKEILSGCISYIKRLRQIVNSHGQTNIEKAFVTQPPKTVEVVERTKKKRLVVRDMLQQRQKINKRLQKSGPIMNPKFQSIVTPYPTVDTVTRLKVEMDYSGCTIKGCPCKVDEAKAIKKNLLQEKNEERLSGIQIDTEIELRDHDYTMPVWLEGSSMRPISQLNFSENSFHPNTLTGKANENNENLWVGCELEISETEKMNLDESSEILKGGIYQKVDQDNESSIGFTIEDISKENYVGEESNDCVIVYHGVDEGTAFEKDTENVQEDFEDFSSEELILGDEAKCIDSISEIVREDCKVNIMGIPDMTVADVVEKVQNWRTDSINENVLYETDSGIKIDGVYSGNWFANYYDAFLKKSD